MTRARSCLIYALLLAAPRVAVAQRRAPPISSDSLRVALFALAHDSMGGRQTGELGDWKAQEWIAEVATARSGTLGGVLAGGVRALRTPLAHAAEERGLLGSAWFSDHPTRCSTTVARTTTATRATASLRSRSRGGSTQTTIR